MLVLASLGSWLPFAIVGLFIICFAILFILRYQQKRRRDYLVTFVCSISLIIALLAASLLPTDVIFVSFMKYPNGTFKEWVSNPTTRDHIQKYIEVGYYVLYGLVIFMAFLVNPFLFFYYEEKQETESNTIPKMYRFSRGRTKPQAILMLCSLLMFIVVAINIFVYLLIPQYAIYGDQHYSAIGNNGTIIIEKCTQFVKTDDCQMTVMGRIILRFFYKVWFFGAIYFCLSWIFLVIFLASFILKLFTHRESNIQEYTVDRLLEGDGDEDDDEPLIQ
ncbi:unnamed protein product [Adineta steineri]|uniref:Lysosomal cobalamin transporter n=1 Tax=Adineta steineri TaxID=433720 RepID=A0A814VCZ9_9BILA|nr:unnamed protein product [Adineta steineri]